MSKYTIQDINVLRRKSGISYNEAVDLLEYHNGSLSQSLLDLENNGRILEKDVNLDENKKEKRKNIIQFLYRLRLKVKKDSITIVNLSMLFLILPLLFAPWILLIGLVFALLLGYRIKIDRNSLEFEDISLEETLRNAGENIKNTVSGIMEDADNHVSKEKTEAPSKSSDQKKNSAKPVSVELKESGELTMTEDEDGFHEASIQ